MTGLSRSRLPRPAGTRRVSDSTVLSLRIPVAHDTPAVVVKNILASLEGKPLTNYKGAFEMILVTNGKVRFLLRFLSVRPPPSPFALVVRVAKHVAPSWPLPSSSSTPRTRTHCFFPSLYCPFAHHRILRLLSSPPTRPHFFFFSSSVYTLPPTPLHSIHSLSHSPTRLTLCVCSISLPPPSLSSSCLVPSRLRNH